MHKSLFAAILISSFLWSCAGSTTDSLVSIDTPITHTVKAGDVKTIATLEIEGMMCEMACGGKIKKELQALKGVKLANIDFDSERKGDLAIVEFDPSVTDESALILAVEQIAEGKLYHVTKMDVVKYEPGQGSVKASDSSEDASFDVRAVFQFPNIFGLLEKLIR